MSEFERDLLDKVQWEIWYQDNFDLSTSRQKVAVGNGLIQGLIELWARHLYETIQPEGDLGFSKFNLWWIQRKISIDIVGDIDGQKKLRDWLFGERRWDTLGYKGIVDKDLLRIIAETHSKLLLKGQYSQEIIAKARISNSREAFIGLINFLGDET